MERRVAGKCPTSSITSPGSRNEMGVPADKVEEALSYEELLERYTTLQGHLKRFTTVQQQLIGARDRLDRELERFSALHRFNTHAMGLTDMRVLAEATAESVIDVFELEFGGLWLAGPTHDLQDGIEALVGLDADVISREDILAWLSSSGSSGIVILDRESRPKLASLGIHQLVLGVCRGSTGQLLGVLLGGVTTDSEGFYEGIETADTGSYTVFTQLVAALVRNQANRTLIESQLRTIQVSEERLAQCLDGGDMGLWDWLLPEDTVFFSDRWMSMLGYEPFELEHSVATWADLIHPDDRPQALQKVEDYLAGRLSHYLNEIRLRRKDGSWSWIMARGKVLRDPNGHPLRMVGVHVDINSQKFAQEAIRTAGEEQRLARRAAEQANRAKSSFLATMSHEIRTPMNGVLGMLQLLQSSTLSHEQSTFVEVAHDSATILLDLIDDILDLSKVEAGRVELEHRAFSPKETIERVVKLLQPKAAPNVTLRAELDATLPPILVGDRGRLRQVIFNLLGNALKFTHAGEVVVSAQYGARADGTETLRMQVTDTGVGIAPAHLSKLFQPFTQADASTTRRFGGTGLGLAICRRLVELMDGTIHVESVEGEGSTFFFNVVCPLGEAPSAPRALEASPASRPTQELAGRRVLLVEDNAVNRQVALLFLQRLGVDAATAENGLQALQVWQKESFDLILMDVHMPVMEGIEATRRIRALEQQTARPRTPVLALTANAMPESRQECLEGGMDGFLTKPIRLNRLQEQLELWLDPV